MRPRRAKSELRRGPISQHNGRHPSLRYANRRPWISGMLPQWPWHREEKPTSASGDGRPRQCQHVIGERTERGERLVHDDHQLALACGFELYLLDLATHGRVLQRMRNFGIGVMGAEVDELLTGSACELVA